MRAASVGWVATQQTVKQPESWVSTQPTLADQLAAVVFRRGIPAAGHYRRLFAGHADHPFRVGYRRLLGAGVAALSPLAAPAPLFRADGAKLGTAAGGAAAGEIPGLVNDDALLQLAVFPVSAALVRRRRNFRRLPVRRPVDGTPARCLTGFQAAAGKRIRIRQPEKHRGLKPADNKRHCRKHCGRGAAFSGCLKAGFGNRRGCKPDKPESSLKVGSRSNLRLLNLDKDFQEFATANNLLPIQIFFIFFIYDVKIFKEI